MTTKITSDYLIVGSGAVGMAFADVLLSETEATITIVDRYPAPGGHWNVAYPFVTLHQPSAFYGVSSKELGKGHVDQVGLNKDCLTASTCTHARVIDCVRLPDHVADIHAVAEPILVCSGVAEPIDRLASEIRHGAGGWRWRRQFRRRARTRWRWR